MEFLKNIPFGEFQWVELFYALLGSFIGIFVPLWLDKIRTRKQEKEARQRLIASIDSELEEIKKSIEVYRSKDLEYDIFSFSTFVWDSVISSGLLPDMYSDKNIQCELLMQIYADLAALKEMNEEFCRSDKKDFLINLNGNIHLLREMIHEKIVQYQANNVKR